jgi:hypothetical protein
MPSEDYSGKLENYRKIIGKLLSNDSGGKSDDYRMISGIELLDVGTEVID